MSVIMITNALPFPPIVEGDLRKGYFERVKFFCRVRKKTEGYGLQVQVFYI